MSSIRWIIFGFTRLLIFTSIVLAVHADVAGRSGNYGIQQREDTYAELDHKAAMAARGGGLYLSFHDFPPEMNWLARDFYTRTVYAMYAQKVLASDPSAAIFSPDQFMAANKQQDADWCLQRGLRGELTFTRKPDGPMISTFHWFSGPQKDQR